MPQSSAGASCWSRPKRIAQTGGTRNMTWEKGFCRTSRVPRLDSLERGVTRRLAPLTPILLTTFGTVPLVAGIAQRLQVSAAIGAFLVGIAVSGPMAGQTHRLVAPLRDLFAATFFFLLGLPFVPVALPGVLAVPRR